MKPINRVKIYFQFIMFTGADIIYATFKINTEHLSLENFKCNLQAFSK